jgi:hypothetical protein
MALGNCRTALDWVFTNRWFALNDSACMERAGGIYLVGIGTKYRLNDVCIYLSDET